MKMNSIEQAAQFETVQAYIDFLNKDSDFMKLADAGHFETYGITTPAGLEEYLFWGSFSDIYKDVNGVRPRWVTDRTEAESILKSLTENN